MTSAGESASDRVGPKLAVNGWRIHGRRTGVGRYLLNVVRHWQEPGPFSSVTFYSPKPLDRSELAFPEWVGSAVLPSNWPMLAWENLLLSRHLRDEILFCPSYSRPLLTRCRTVVTTHDAVQQVYPELFPVSVRLFYNRLYGWSARHATLVITDSEAGRDDIVRCWGVPTEKIRVIYLAPAEFLHRITSASELAQAQEITGSNAPFFLFVGKISGRRNLPCLLEAFGQFKRETKSPHVLVLAGLNPRSLNLDAISSQFGVSDSVRYCEYLNDERINLLYNSAQALVMPSVYETVSLPVMEAQAVGTPVICIDTGGMREVTGGAALFVKSLEPDLLARAMADMALNAELRSKLSEQGLRNAERFSWQRCATETMAVLAEAARMS